MMNTYVYKPINMQATGQRIRQIRKARNFTLEELSEFLGISPQAISKWQRGDALPSIDNLMVLCDIFETHVEDLIVREDDRSSVFCQQLAAQQLESTIGAALPMVGLNVFLIFFVKTVDFSKKEVYTDAELNDDI